MKIVHIHKNMHFYNTVNRSTLVARLKKIRLINVTIKNIQNVKRELHQTKHLTLYYIAINNLPMFIYLEL